MSQLQATSVRTGRWALGSEMLRYPLAHIT